ncbi:MAG: pilus assembly protein TadG-related protein [Acidimicrobiia bacterium]
MRHLGTDGKADERGAVLVMFSLVLIMLFGFMVLAVDASHAFVERRNSQSAADVAAVGAAVQAIENTGTDAQIADEIIAEAQRLVQLNISTSDWAACNDADALPFTWASERGGATNCVSWSEGFRRVRVRVPTRNIDTFFASIIGIDSVAVAAAAEVEGLAEGLGGILPFGVLSDAGDGSLLCLKTQNGQNKVPAACDPAVSGNFGYLDFTIHGGVIPGADQNCIGQPVNRLTENVAHGIDHELGIGPADETGPGVILDPDKCSNPLLGGGAPVNGTEAKTGTSFTGVIYPGFIGGTSNPSPAFPGRLTVTQGPTYNWNGIEVDDEPLWAHLIPAKRTQCEPLSEEVAASPRWGDIDVIDTEEEMVSCIAYHYSLSTTSDIFQDLKDSPRFGSVPRLHKTWPPGGSADRTFAGFVTIYVQALFGGNCTQADGTCGTWFEPGGLKRNTTSTQMTGVTAIAIPDGLVPQSDLDALQGLPEIREYLIVE